MLLRILHVLEHRSGKTFVQNSFTATIFIFLAVYLTKLMRIWDNLMFSGQGYIVSLYFICKILMSIMNRDVLLEEL